MRPPACATVLQALQRNDSVTVFSIGWNGVGSQGCQALADCLRANSTPRLDFTQISMPSLLLF